MVPVSAGKVSVKLVVDGLAGSKEMLPVAAELLNLTLPLLVLDVPRVRLDEP